MSLFDLFVTSSLWSRAKSFGASASRARFVFLRSRPWARTFSRLLSRDFFLRQALQARLLACFGLPHSHLSVSRLTELHTLGMLLGYRCNERWSSVLPTIFVERKASSSQRRFGGICPTRCKRFAVSRDYEFFKAKDGPSGNVDCCGLLRYPLQDSSQR